MGPFENPITPQKECKLRNIANDDDDINACLCTSPFCNLAGSYKLKDGGISRNVAAKNIKTPNRTLKAKPGITSKINKNSSYNVETVLNVIIYISSPVQENRIPKKQLTSRKTPVPLIKETHISGKFYA